MLDAMPSVLVAILLTLDAIQVQAALRVRATAARTNTVTQLIVKHARAVDVDPVLVAAIVSVENPRLSPTARHRTNVGIMQVSTRWSRRGDWQRACGIDLLHVETNICFGVRVLRLHLAEHESLVDGLLGYNGCKSAKCRGYAATVLARRDAARARLNAPEND